MAISNKLTTSVLQGNSGNAAIIRSLGIGTSARLAEVFDVEGATEQNESAFSAEGLSFSLERTADGKAKATVTPDGAPPAFFLRVKVK